MAIIPFRAGAGVAATSELEKAALMFVKGLSEALASQGSSFTIVPADQVDSADLVIQGHITTFKQLQGLKHRLLGKNQSILKMEGKMVDQKTNKEVFYFVEQEASEKKDSDLKEFGLTIGRGVGEFMLDHVKK